MDTQVPLREKCAEEVLETPQKQLPRKEFLQSGLRNYGLGVRGAGVQGCSIPRRLQSLAVLSIGIGLQD